MVIRQIQFENNFFLLLEMSYGNYFKLKFIFMLESHDYDFVASV